MEVVGDRDILHPHVVDEAMAHDRARRLVVWRDRGRQEELDVEVCALMETQQLQRRLSDAEDPARDEARVLGEEAMLAISISADIAKAIADHEGASVQHTHGALIHLESSIATRRERHGPVGALVGGGDDLAIAMLAHPVTAVTCIDSRQMADRVGHRPLVLDQESGPAIDHELTGRALRECDHRGPAGERFDHHHPERLIPPDRHQQPTRRSEQ